jgi:hypothetical protein
MENLITTPVSSDIALDQAGNTAVLNQTNADAVTDTVTDTVTSPSAQSIVDTIAPVIPTYTREQLMAARHLVLSVKRTARQAGYGQQAGKSLRAAVGYKFDSMDVMQMLAEMAKEGFLVRYKDAVEKWFAGLNKSATDSTLKKNQSLYEAALKLAADPNGFQLLVKSLQVLCVRNQDWREEGDHLSIPMNGHRALLDLFGINVTNARRLALTAE